MDSFGSGFDFGNFSFSFSKTNAQTTDIPSEEVTDALLYDANVYASNVGISLDEAVKRLQFQDIAGDLEAKLIENEADTFAGMWVENTPKFLFVVLFTRNGQETINTYIPQALSGMVEVRTAKVSLTQLEQTQKEAHASISNLGIPVESDINVFKNRVEIYVTVADQGKLNEAVESGKVQLPDEVILIPVQEMGKPATDVYGGLALTTCTSGFSVKQNGTNTKGVTTAGHCGNSQSFMGIPLAFQSQMWAGTYDVQWHTATGFTVTNKIQISSTSTRDIAATRSRNNQLIGGLVCKYGMTTGWTCGYIASKNNCPIWVPSCQGTFIRLDNTAGYPVITAQGDSGGPCFLGNTAYGIMSGIPSDDTGDAIYMAVNYISPGLGVTVMTSP
ncbi:MAG: S1 family peptidase [Anaerolineales bacterium]